MLCEFKRYDMKSIFLRITILLQEKKTLLFKEIWGECDGKDN